MPSYIIFMAPETRQQLIALVLGIVFIVGFILFAQRFGQFLRNRQQQGKVASEKISPAPTSSLNNESQKGILSPTPIVYRANGTMQTQNTQPRSIPSTGPETTLLVSFIGMLGAGIVLRGKK